MLIKGIKNFLKQRKTKDENIVVKGYKNLPEVEKRGCLSRENKISKNRKTKLLHKQRVTDVFWLERYVCNIYSEQIYKLIFLRFLFPVNGEVL